MGFQAGPRGSRAFYGGPGVLLEVLGVLRGASGVSGAPHGFSGAFQEISWDVAGDLRGVLESSKGFQGVHEDIRSVSGGFKEYLQVLRAFHGVS